MIILLHGIRCHFSSVTLELIGCSDWSSVKDLVDNGLLIEKRWQAPARYYPTALALKFAI